MQTEAKQTFLVPLLPPASFFKLKAHADCSWCALFLSLYLKKIAFSEFVIINTQMSIDSSAVILGHSDLLNFADYFPVSHLRIWKTDWTAVQYRLLLVLITYTVIRRISEKGRGGKVPIIPATLNDCNSSHLALKPPKCMAEGFSVW